MYAGNDDTVSVLCKAGLAEMVSLSIAAARCDGGLSHDDILEISRGDQCENVLYIALHKNGRSEYDNSVWFLGGGCCERASHGVTAHIVDVFLDALPYSSGCGEMVEGLLDRDCSCIGVYARIFKHLKEPEVLIRRCFDSAKEVVALGYGRTWCPMMFDCADRLGIEWDDDEFPLDKWVEVLWLHDGWNEYKKKCESVPYWHRPRDTCTAHDM